MNLSTIPENWERDFFALLVLDSGGTFWNFTQEMNIRVNYTDEY